MINLINNNHLSIKTEKITKVKVHSASYHKTKIISVQFIWKASILSPLFLILGLFLFYMMYIFSLCVFVNSPWRTDVLEKLESSGGTTELLETV